MWQLLLWGSVLLIAYIYVGYPALLYLIGRIRKPYIPPEHLVSHPSVALIISAFNEEQVIRQKIRNSLALDYNPELFSLIVVSDGSTDETPAIVREFENQGVQLYHSVVRKGKSAALNEVVRQLDHDIIVFTDANSVFSPDAVQMLCRNFEEPTVGCVVGRLRYIEDGASCVGKGEGMYWRYESKISRLESALKSVLVANGSIFAIRRSLYRDVHPAVPNDFQTPIDIAAEGHGVVYECEALAEERTTSHWLEEFRRKVRIILRGLTGFSTLRHQLRGMRRWQLWSHKLLRWMVGLMLLTAFISNSVLAASSTFYTITMAVQVLFYLVAMLGWWLKNSHTPRRFFYLPFYFTMVNAAAMVGLLKFLAGQRQSVWEKAESTRLVPVPTPQPREVPDSMLAADHVDPPRAEAAKN